MRETGVRIDKPTGWEEIVGSNYAAKDFLDPVTREEFFERSMLSECSRFPDPPYDERPEPPNEFVTVLAEALKSEFGTQFGMGINAKDESWKRVARGMALKMRCEQDHSNPHSKFFNFLFSKDPE